MLSHWRRFLSLSALCAFTLIFTACGDDDDDDSGADAPDDDTAVDDDALDDDADDDVDDDTTADDDADDDTIPDDDADDDTSVDDDIDDDAGDDDTYVCDPDPLPAMTYDESPDAGFLRLKAQEYDLWHEQWHQPNYGSTVETSFTDASRTVASGYGGLGDSCIWTGTYIASQAFRYYVTHDDQAKQNVLRSVAALDRHLHVTGRDGFIARYVGPMSDPVYGDVAGRCADPESNWYCVTEGEFAGDFFITNTSRDQYTGWFYGLGLAFDLVDDQDMRDMIAADMTEVLDRLIADNWWIKDVDGLPTTAGPNALSSQQQTWALIGWHVTGEERFRAVFDQWADPSMQTVLRLSNISITNRYAQHYGLNLGHQNFYNLLRLGRVDCRSYLFNAQLFREQIHGVCDLSHNAFFTYIHMTQSNLEPGDDYNAQQAQALQDITDFRPAPNFEYWVDPPDAPLDPVSVFLADLQAQYPWLADIMGTVNYQAQDAYPVLEQCSTDFLWQRNPWAIGPCGSDNPAHVNPGADYLVAYWMATAYGFVTKDM